MVKMVHFMLCIFYHNKKVIIIIKKKELPYDPAILLLGIYLKKTKTLTRKDTHTPMFTAALFTIAKMWRKQAKCPSTDEWIKKMWYVYTYKGVLLSPKRE